MRAAKLIPWLVLAVGVAAYHNCGPNAFQFDDKTGIIENARIRQLWPPLAILLQSSRPVVELTLAVNYALGGLNPVGYHAVNVAIHLLAALLLYGIVRRTLESELLRHRWAGPAPWLAGAIAALWVAHPLQTQSVTYLIQRAESLMGLFYLLTLYAVIRSLDSARPQRWKLLAVVACALGMATKEVMVTAPLAVLLYDRAFLSASWRAAWQRRRQLYLDLAGTWLVLPIVMSRWSETAPTVGLGVKEISPWQYALTQAGVILHYLRLAVWPDQLCLDYGSLRYGSGWPIARSIGDAAPAVVGVGLLLAATAWAWRRQPAWGFVGAWFFVILAPTSSVVPVADVIFEHRLYLSLAAVITLVVLGGALLIQRLAEPWRKVGWYGGAVVTLALVATLGAVTVRRNLDYRSAQSMWRDVIQKCPANPRGYNNLGLLLSEAGQFPAAISLFEQALRLAPNLAETHNNLANALAQSGQTPAAIHHFHEALRLKPEAVTSRFNLGLALNLAGRFTDAIPEFEEVLRHKPDLAEAHYQLGLALKKANRPADAAPHLEQARRLNPRLFDTPP